MDVPARPHRLPLRLERIEELRRQFGQEPIPATAEQIYILRQALGPWLEELRTTRRHNRQRRGVADG